MRATCVPPQSSTEKACVCAVRASPIETTRTSSPYFSPNSARAPDVDRFVDAPSAASSTGAFCEHDALAMSSTAPSSSSLIGFGWREVEAQAVGRDQRAFLRDVIAEHLAQRLVQEMRRRMVGADGARGAA